MTPTPRLPIPSPLWSNHPVQADVLTPEPPPTVRVVVPNSPPPDRPSTDTPPPVLRLSTAVLSDGEPNGTAGNMPIPGDVFLGFTLVEELGRGAFARVFLAKQDSLANRFVAVKVTRRPTREAEKLARLQHTNVVPVYSVHAADPIQVICMPYLGRRTLADALRAFHRDHPSRAPSGRRTWGTHRQGTTKVAGSRSGPATGQVSGGYPRPVFEPAPETVPLVGDVSAVLRCVGALAAGLAHAHGRNILHLDIKPANVLLADTGEPMLLDFNLSFDTTGPDRDMIGGTVQYMAPEQLLDVRSGGKGGVDARTDLYSLGVLTYELLTGLAPFPASSQRGTDFNTLMAARRNPLPPASRRNSAVTPAVDAILGKLLAPDPSDRYQSATDLRADIERQLTDNTLRFARDRSIRERFRKWRRRNPWVVARLVAAVLIGLVLGTGVAFERQSAARATAEAAIRAGAARAALPTLQLDLILPDDPTARARGKQRAAELLAEYGLPDDPDWRSREAFARTPAGDRPGLAADLGELLALLANARWQEGKHRPNAERVEAAAAALRLNQLARGCFAEDAVPPFLVRQHAELAVAAGEIPGEVAVRVAENAASPKSSRDHFLNAVDAITAGRYAAAVGPLEQAIAGQPDHAASQFCLAYCRQKLGQHARALERYDTARVLIPTDARPPYFRGVVFALERQAGPAEVEFTRAIELNPGLAVAYRDRAFVRLKLGKTREAEEDLTVGLERGGAPFQFRTLRAHARDTLGDGAGAEADRKELRDARPEREMDFLVRGYLRMRDDPRAALADFDSALAINPRSIPALQDRVHVLAIRIGDLPAALEAATRFVELYPEYAPARANRGSVLARLGRRAEALEEARLARTLSDDPTVTFQLACIHAQTSIREPADRGEALALLRQAFRDGYRDIRVFETEPALNPLRKLPEFDRLRTAVKELHK